MFLNGGDFLTDSEWLSDFKNSIETLKNLYSRGENKKNLSGCISVYARPTYQIDLKKCMKTKKFFINNELKKQKKSLIERENIYNLYKQSYDIMDIYQKRQFLIDNNIQGSNYIFKKDFSRLVYLYVKIYDILKNSNIPITNIEDYINIITKQRGFNNITRILSLNKKIVELNISK